jgi:hypothetical protein
MNNSILNINVSCYLNVKSTVPAEVNLLTWLTSDKHREKVEQIRSLQDEDLQKKIKATLPAITPSGVFSYRNSKHLIEHTGLLAFDIDFKDNSHISNFTELREQISHISSVAYCGLSVRGQGFWGLVPIPKSTPEIHKLRFEALKNDFEQFGINLDISGSDVCRLRFYSWDPQAYFNHKAKIYCKLPKPKQGKDIFTRPAESDTRWWVEAVIANVKELQIDITNSYKDEWFSWAAALANEFGEGGRGYFHDVSQLHPDYTVHDSDVMFDRCLKHCYSDITISTFFHIVKKYGIDLKEISKMSNN